MKCTAVGAVLDGVVVMVVVVVMSSEGHPSVSHATSKLRPDSDISGAVQVAVWSGPRGWGLVAEGVAQAARPHPGGPRVRVREGSTLGPAEEGRSPASPGQGVTLSVLNARQGTLILHKVFPLWQYWAHWADLEWHLQRVTPGRLVVMAVAVSGAVGLRHAALRLAALGSLFATHLPPTAHWTWVFIKGGRTLSETVTLHARGAHHAHLLLPLSTLPYPPTSEPRWHYCAAHGAMGGLCDEHEPDPLPPPPPLPVARQAALAKVPVIVTAGARHHYLYHTLTTLMAAPGALHHNIHVVLGDAPPSTTALLHLLGLNFTTLAVSGRDNHKLFRYYRDVYRLLDTAFPDAPAAILLDEDVEVSPDFFSFFSQTLWLLQADTTLYCVNAYSATGFRGIAHDPHTLVRGSVQVEWGYAVTLDFVRDINTRWPSEPPQNDTLFYDEWLFRHGGRGRECVFPEVSRSRHFGVGVNTDPWSTEVYFLAKPLVARPSVPLADVAGVVWGPWQRRFSAALRSATPLTGNPCGSSFVPRVNTTTNFIFFYKQTRKPDGQPDYTNYYFAAKCLNAWGVSAQGMHQGVLMVRASMGATVYLVGAPYSMYGHLCPPRLRPWQYAALTNRQHQVLINKIRRLEIGDYHVANTNTTAETLAEVLAGHTT